jgi:serine/threonine protein kinase
MLLAREGRRELIRQFVDESGPHTVTEREKNFDLVKILDFGVAKVHDPDVADGRVTQRGVVFGTPEYMAPETARVGLSDPRSDIWALGVMFYEMLTGTVPFIGETPVDVMMKVVSQPVIPPRERGVDNEITEEAEQLIMRALAKDPNQRQQSMEELYDELQRCYGSVRYRRSLETPPPWVRNQPTPIQLQKVKRPGNRAATSGEIGSLEQTPPERTPIVVPRTGPEPILLTRRKDRKRTLPLEIEISAGAPVATPVPTAIAPQTTSEIWADMAVEDDADAETPLSLGDGDEPALDGVPVDKAKGSG